MENAKEEIKARLAIEDVVGRYVELKKAGRNLKGRSPWGVDKTPSFMVSPEKGIWHDFSANKGGDIFTFLMMVEGISFGEALEKLAREAGVELKRYDGGDKKVLEKKKRLLACLEWACKYYQVCLTKNKIAGEYIFYKRNLNRKTIMKFRIGYAPKEGNALKQFLLKKGFLEMEMREAGLLNQYGGDLFRGRMMVPFMATTGEVIGFTARIIGQGEPKYLNTNDTLLFNKGRFIFGLAQAKEAIRENGFVVVVEGNMDVISSHQVGVCEAVATSGTAMTEYQLKALAKLTKDIRLAYDMDEAGVAAAERAIKIAGSLDLKLRVISDYKGAKDPDELIQKDAKLWKEAVGNYVPAMDFVMDKYEEKFDLRDGAEKRDYAKLILSMMKGLDKIEQAHYVAKLAERIEVKEEFLQDLVEFGEVKEKQVKKWLKKAKEIKDDKEKELIAQAKKELWSIILFGGVDGDFMGELEMPEDQVLVDELGLIFENKFAWRKGLGEVARGLWEKVRAFEIKSEITRLSEEAEKLEEEGKEESEEYRKKMREIVDLQRGL